MSPKDPTGLLDTSTIILLSRLEAEAPLPSQGAVSAITLAELCVGPLLATDPQSVAMRQAEVALADLTLPLLPFDRSAAMAYGHVVASMRSAGRKSASRTTDAMIAAVAVANGLPLYTCNAGDVAGIDGLEVVPIPHPDRN